MKTHQIKPPEWVTTQIRSAIQHLATGTTHCPHFPNNPPDIAYAPLWKPDWLLCVDCLPTAKLPEHSEADQTCDRCGTVEPLNPVMIANMGVAVNWSTGRKLSVTACFGLCESCSHDLIKPPTR